MSRWPVAGPSGYWLLTSSPTSKVSHFVNRAVVSPWGLLAFFSVLEMENVRSLWDNHAEYMCLSGRQNSWPILTKLDILGQLKVVLSSLLQLMQTHLHMCEVKSGLRRCELTHSVRAASKQEPLLRYGGREIYRVSQEERTKLRESVPYVKLYRYNPEHLYPKLNGYGDNGQRKVWTSCISA